MARDFDYESLSYVDRKDIHEALAETTIKHIESASDIFSAIPFDPAASPSQLLETVHLTPVPAEFEEIDFLATGARPNFYPFVKETFARQRALMSAVRLMLQEGTHIFPVTTHGSIDDVAEWSAAWAAGLDEKTWQDQNGLVISRGVTTIQAFGLMAASEVVQKIGHVFMSFPRTPTISELGFDDTLISTNNRRMRTEIKHWLGDDIRHRIGRHALGKSLHLAWSGKTDKVRYGDDHKPAHISLGKVSDGTLDIVKRGLVLPVAIWNGDEPVLEIGELTRVENAQDVRKVQKWQADTLAHALGLPAESVTVEE